MGFNNNGQIIFLFASYAQFSLGSEAGNRTVGVCMSVKPHWPLWLGHRPAAGISGGNQPRAWPC